MVKIRLKRIGGKGKPSYRIVVIDSRKARDSEAIEEIGFYQPAQDPAAFKVDEERAILWLERGAIPTPTAGAILNRAGVIEKWRARKNAK